MKLPATDSIGCGDAAEKNPMPIIGITTACAMAQRMTPHVAQFRQLLESLRVTRDIALRIGHAFS
jgi:hypothetical protein